MRRDGRFGHTLIGDNDVDCFPRIKEKDFKKAISQIRQTNMTGMEHIDKEVIIAAMKRAYCLCEKTNQVIDAKVGELANTQTTTSKGSTTLFGNYIRHLKAKNPNLNQGSYFIQDRNGNKMSAKTLGRHYDAIVASIGPNYALSNQKNIWGDLRQSGACRAYNSVKDSGFTCKEAFTCAAKALELENNRVQVRDLLGDNVKEDGRKSYPPSSTRYFMDKILKVADDKWNGYDKKTIKAMHQKFIEEVDASKNPEIKKDADSLKKMMEDSLKEKGLID